MYLNAQVYRSLCCSLFSFVWQLEEPPPEVLKLELWALRRLAPGPGNWIRAVDLQNLRRYGHTFEFAGFKRSAIASTLRVLQFEPQLDCSRMHSNLLDIFATASVSDKV